MKRGWTATFAVALIALLAPSLAAADADPFFGVVSQQEHLSDSDFERMGQGHVGTLRVALPWLEVDPSPVPADYDWSRFDSVVARPPRGHGITVLPTVYTVPAWVSTLEGCTSRRAVRARSPRPTPSSGSRAWRTFLGAAVAPLRTRRAVLGPAPGPRPAPRSAPGRSGTSRTRPASFSRGPTSTATRACSAPRRTRSAARTRTPRSSSAGCSATRSTAAKGGIKATDYLRELYAHPGHRGGLRRRRDPPLRRARASRSPSRSERMVHTGARGRRPAGRDLGHRDRLGLGRQAQPAEPRAARTGAAAHAGVSLLRPRARARWGSGRSSGTHGATCRRPRAAASGARTRASSAPARSSPKLAWDSFVRFTGGSLTAAVTRTR